MSHPHDGYDSETGDFEPVGEHYFAWSGDESNTMMSYIDLNWDFSQFDRDNMDRFSAAAYLEQTNAVAALILESDNARAAKRELELADATATLAARAFANHNYAGAVTRAKAAYRLAARRGRRRWCRGHRQRCLPHGAARRRGVRRKQGCGA